MRRSILSYDTQDVRLLTPFPVVIVVGVVCSLAAIGSQRFNAALVAAAPIPQASTQSRPAESAVTQPQPDLLVAEATPAAAARAESPIVFPPSEPVPSAPARLVALSIAGVADGDKAKALLATMNAARHTVGLDPLSEKPELDAVAAIRARDMVARSYFDHFSPDGASAFSELAARGIAYELAGENLARNTYTSQQSVQVAFASLMASPGHRANILEGQFSYVGVAVLQSGRTWLYVAVFTSAN